MCYTVHILTDGEDKMKASVMRRSAVARALAVLCTLLWGTAFPFIKLGYRVLAVAEGDVGASLLFAGLRFSLAGLMVLCFLCAQKRRFVPLRRDCLAPVLLLGGFQTLGQYLFTYIGIGFTTGANTSIITACEKKRILSSILRMKMSDIVSPTLNIIRT